MFFIYYAKIDYGVVLEIGDCVKQAYQYLMNLLTENDVIIVGVSGGPDSMALLYLLKEIRKKLNISLVCSHVNHNVRKESAKEKIFLENWCRQNDILFESMIIEKYGDDNFHNEARSIRYHYFESLIDKYHANYLMTAHHGDDLMETILMRLTRGSTLKGYGGFCQEVAKENYKIIRPLVYATKKEIEDFNKKKKIPYVIDQSNKKIKYTRNRYRKIVLPFLKKEDRNVHEKFLKFSNIIREYDEYINVQVQKAFSKVYQNNILCISEYLQLDKLLQDKVLYNLLENVYQDDLILVNDKHISLIKRLIISTKKNTYAYLPNNIKIIREYNQIQFIHDGESVDDYNIELIDYAILPNGKHLEMVDTCDTNGNDICRLDSSDIVLPLYVRTRKHGDKMSLKGTNGHKKIKDILMDSKIPMKDRELWPVVVDSKDTIVWLPDLKKSKFNKQKNEKCDIIIKYY